MAVYDIARARYGTVRVDDHPGPAIIHGGITEGTVCSKLMSDFSHCDGVVSLSGLTPSATQWVQLAGT